MDVALIVSEKVSMAVPELASNVKNCNTGLTMSVVYMCACKLDTSLITLLFISVMALGTTDMKVVKVLLASSGMALIAFASVNPSATVMTIQFALLEELLGVNVYE